MFSLTEVTRDPRVRRVARTLADAGYKVTVLVGVLNPERDVEREVLEGYQVVRLKIPENLSADAMRRFTHRYPAMGQLLSEIEPRLFVDHLYQAVALRAVRLVPGGLIWARRFLGHWKKGWSQTGKYSTAGKETTSAAREAGMFLQILRLRITLLLNQALYEAAAALHPDLYHCNDLNTLVAGCIGKMEGRLPLVYDAHEIYVEQLPEEARSEIWYNFYSALETRLLRFADRRMTVCDSLGRWFEKKYESGPFVTVMNCPSLKLLPAHSALDREIEYPVKLLYHGAYFPYRGLEQIIDVSARLANAHIIFRGFGPLEKALRQRVEAKGLEDRVVFSPPVPMLELIPRATEADIGLNPFAPVCLNTEFCLPNKLFEYMMAGLAVANSDLVELRRITEQYRIGQLFDPKDPEEMATVLNSMVSDRRRLREYQHASLKAAREVFYWEREQEKLLAEVYNW